MVSMVLLFPTKSWAIPAFARLYSLQCSTCHSAFPALNDLGEQFKMSGYRRFSKGDVIPVSPPVKIGERLELPAVLPLSIAVNAGFNFVQLNNTHIDGSRNPSTDPEFRRTSNSFDLNGMDIHAGAPLGPHLSFFLSFPIAGTDIRQFWDPDVKSKGTTSDIGGPSVPDLLYLGVHDIFIKDLLNVRAGISPLPLPFSPDANRLSLFPYLVYEAKALDVISTQGIDHFQQVGAVDLGEHQFALAESQIGIHLFGRVTPALHKIPGLYVDYTVGVVNGDNVNPDNNKTKDGFARLAVTYPIEHLTMRLGGFGYYSGNILDSRTTIPGTESADGTGGVHYKNRLWRVGPDISFTLSDPIYAKVFSQILFARDSNATGFGKAATSWGGFVQGEVKPLDQLIVYARYDWINGDRFNDSNVTINGVSGTTGLVHPRLWDTVVGAQFYLYQNFKLFAEYRYGEKRLRPGASSNEDLGKTTENAVRTGFHIGF